MQTRRSLLIGSAALIPVITLAACGTKPTPSQIATDVALIASGLGRAVPAIAQVPGVPADVATQLGSYLAIIQGGAATVASATAAPATSTVQEIVRAVQAIASIVLPLAAGAVPGLAPFVPLIEAAVSLLPVILAAAGLSGGDLTGPRYTPNEARLVLIAG